MIKNIDPRYRMTNVAKRNDGISSIYPVSPSKEIAMENG